MKFRGCSEKVPTSVLIGTVKLASGVAKIFNPKEVPNKSVE